MANKKREALDPLQKHELLDRSYIIMCMIDTLLRHHPAAQRRPELNVILTRLTSSTKLSARWRSEYG
jgi:hypothetical protein